MKYEHLVASGIAKSDNYSIIEIDLLKFSKYMSSKPNDQEPVSKLWCIEKEDRILGDFKEVRYLRNMEHIKNNEDIYNPELFCERDEISIMDGRHRMYAFIDSGYTKLDIFCPVKDAKKIKSMF